MKPFTYYLLGILCFLNPYLSVAANEASLTVEYAPLDTFDNLPVDAALEPRGVEQWAAGAIGSEGITEGYMLMHGLTLSGEGLAGSYTIVAPDGGDMAEISGGFVSLKAPQSLIDKSTVADGEESAYSPIVGIVRLTEALTTTPAQDVETVTGTASATQGSGTLEFTLSQGAASVPITTTDEPRDIDIDAFTLGDRQQAPVAGWNNGDETTAPTTFSWLLASGGADRPYADIFHRMTLSAIQDSDADGIPDLFDGDVQDGGGGTPDRVFGGYTADASGQKDTWMGIVNDAQYPLIFSAHHGWVTASGWDNDLWLFDYNIGDWLWTSESVYRFMYSEAHTSWLWYGDGVAPERWMYIYAIAEWQQM